MFGNLPVPEDEWLVFDGVEELRNTLESEKWDLAVIGGGWKAGDPAGAVNIAANLKRIQPSLQFAVVAKDPPEGTAGYKNVSHIPVGDTPERTAGHIIDFVYGNQAPPAAAQNNIVTFIGSTPNIGTTIVSFGTAAVLAQSAEQSIGYICLNLKSSKLHRYMGKDESPFALDGLRAEIKCRGLSGNRLLQYSESVKGIPNLHLLYGTVQREQAEFYEPEDVEHLLQAASQAFDVCIVEVNAYWDNAATVVAMLEAGQRVVVTTANLGHFQEDMDRGLKAMAAVYGIPAESILLALNMYDSLEGSGGISNVDIRKETGMKIAAEVGRHRDLLECVNQGRLLDLFLGNHPVKQQLLPLAHRFILHFGLMKQAAASRRSWFRRLLPGLQGN